MSVVRALASFIKDGASVVFAGEDGSSLDLTPGSGSQTVKAVDLGLLDLAAIFTGGPVTLYTLAAGEYLARIEFADDGFEDLDVLPFAYGVGPVSSFGFGTFAKVGGAPSNDPAATNYLGTMAQVQGFASYDPRMVALGTKAGQSPTGQTLASSIEGAVQAALWIPPAGGANDIVGAGRGIRLAAVAAWAAHTAYGAPSDNTAATPGALLRAAILANGTVWQSVGVGATSGGSSPDFAGSAGGVASDTVTSLPITAVDQGAGSFTVAGDHTAVFKPGEFSAGAYIGGSGFTVAGSTGNDGAYIVATVALVGGDTVVTISNNPQSPFLGSIADATADGSIDTGLIWLDMGIGPTTAGKVRAVAEIWAPA